MDGTTDQLRIKLSVDELRTSATALELIKKVVSRQKNLVRGPKNIAEAIPQEFLEADSEVLDAVNLQEVYNAFAASSSHLFRFVMNYRYHKEVDTNGKILYFCQIASQYADGLDFTTPTKRIAGWSIFNLFQITLQTECL